MEINDVLEILFQVVILPLIPLVAVYLKGLIETKTKELQAKIENEQLDKYLAMANDILQTVVVETSQVYVESLKAQGEFDLEAQQEAFNMAKEKFEAIASEEIKNAISVVVDDYDAFITSSIEAIVNQNK